MILAGGCSSSSRPEDTGGDRAAGEAVITQQACGSCHVIPGISLADGRVGPSLAHFASQKMIAGVLPNTQGDLERFLLSPQSVVPGNAMPDMALTPAQARDVAAYLRGLQ